MNSRRTNILSYHQNLPLQNQTEPLPLIFSKRLEEAVTAELETSRPQTLNLLGKAEVLWDAFF